MKTGVTGELVTPMLKPFSFRPLWSARTISQSFSWYSGWLRMSSRRFRAPITMGMGSDLA